MYVFFATKTLKLASIYLYMMENKNKMDQNGPLQAELSSSVAARGGGASLCAARCSVSSGCDSKTREFIPNDLELLFLSFFFYEVAYISGYLVKKKPKKMEF